MRRRISCLCFVFDGDGLLCMQTTNEKVLHVMSLTCLMIYLRAALHLYSMACEDVLSMIIFVLSICADSWPLFRSRCPSSSFILGRRLLIPTVVLIQMLQSISKICPTWLQTWSSQTGSCLASHGRIFLTKESSFSQIHSLRRGCALAVRPADH